MPTTYHIHVDIQPDIDTPRWVPFKIYDKLEQELNHLVNVKIIEKVNVPTNCLSQLYSYYDEKE